MDSDLKHALGNRNERIAAHLRSWLFDRTPRTFAERQNELFLMQALALAKPSLVG
jgi:hypothetical protein